MIDHAFLPDPQRAQALDQQMNREWGLSLQHVCEQSLGALHFDQPRIRSLIEHAVGGGRVPPGAFARYFNLVKAIYRQDRIGTERLLEELADTKPMSHDLEIVALGDDALAQDSELYVEKWQENETRETSFCPPLEETAYYFRDRLDEGLSLVECALPDLYGEIRAIVHQIVISGSDPRLKNQFNGGSHYQLWGALFLNGRFHPDRVAVAEVLAHESAHSLLFGFCTHEGLVNNDEDAVYTSPLRDDPRPMDGIYHATFVSARMHWAMTQLSECPLLTSNERNRAGQAVKKDKTNFQAGYSVINDHGLLTESGYVLMNGAREYIDAAI